MKEPTFGEVLMSTIREIAKYTVPPGMLEDEEDDHEDSNGRQ